MSQVQISDKFGNRLPVMHYTVSLSDNPDEPYLDDYFTDYAGASTWPRAGIPHDNVFLHVNHFNNDPDFKYQRVPVSTVHDVQIELERAERERAIIQGYYSNVFLKGESGFLDLCRLLHGENIRPLLNQSLDMRSNGRRNFLMTSNTAQAAGFPPFNPDDFPNYYDMFEEMVKLYAEYGLYLYGSVFPDNGLFSSWAGNTQKQIDHWNRLGTIAQRYNNVWGLELTNEINSKVYNKVDQARFSPISGVICCSGSWTDDSGSPLDYPVQFELVDFHQRRDYPKSVVDACVANYPWREKGKATLLGESIGFGSKATNPNREDNPRIAKEIAGSGRGTSCGMIYHSTHGAFSQLYDDTEKACGEAWFNELEGA